MAIVMPQLSITQFLLVQTVTQCINMVDVISGQPLCKEIQHNNFHCTPGWTSTCVRSWEIDVPKSSTPHQPGTSTTFSVCKGITSSPPLPPSPHPSPPPPPPTPPPPPHPPRRALRLLSRMAPDRRRPRRTRSLHAER